jgi:hypothetical protein
VSASALPPFKMLAASLRRTTERLAREVVEPSATEPDWSEVEWAVARSAAAMQGISTLLANSLLWSGPPAWLAFLAEQREQSVLRHERIGQLLAQVDAALRSRGVECVALKGAALRALDLYRPGERPMGDVDVLAAGSALESVAAAMADVGYVQAAVKKRHLVYEPRQARPPRGFGEHIDNPLKIEVHTVIAEQLPVRSVEITEDIRLGATRPGLNAYRDRSSLFLHLLLHAAGNIRAHALRQIQLHDIALVASFFDEHDWHALLRDSHGYKRWWLFPPLALAARYYEAHIPADVLRAASAACPPILRVASARQSLTDVSWSNLRIHAFPGIAWSRTPLDALRFMLARASPSRSALAELNLARRAQPQLDQVPWYGVPHGSRILRWLFSRPPRVQTIVAVRAALESAGSRATRPAD